MNDDQLVVRALEPGDAPQVADVMNRPRAVWGTLQTPYTSVEAHQKRHAATSDGDTLLVATIGGKVIGTGGLHTTRRHRRAHAASLGMAVHDDYTGRGAGSATCRPP